MDNNTTDIAIDKIVDYYPHVSFVFVLLLHIEYIVILPLVKLVFLYSVFSNALPNCLLDRRHNHIGCICLSFLRCGFLSGSLNCLHEEMKSHIGCIGLKFFQCEISNVLLNGIHVRKHGHIGRICLAFLRDVFSNE